MAGRDLGRRNLTTYPFNLVYRPARYSLSVTVAPAEEPVTAAELKAQIRETGSDEDTLIGDLITAARQMVEMRTRRALITQTRLLKMDRFPTSDAQVFELPGGVISSISSITYQDASDSTQAWASSNYETDFGTDGGTGRVGLALDKSWPDVRTNTLGVSVTYVCGYGAAAAVPESLKLAIKMIAADLFDRRHAATIEDYSMNEMVSAVLSQYVVHRVA